MLGYTFFWSCIQRMLNTFVSVRKDNTEEAKYVHFISFGLVIVSLSIKNLFLQKLQSRLAKMHPCVLVSGTAV
jgi:hypothetical protein